MKITSNRTSNKQTPVKEDNSIEREQNKILQAIFKKAPGDEANSDEDKLYPMQEPDNIKEEKTKKDKKKSKKKDKKKDKKRDKKKKKKDSEAETASKENESMPTSKEPSEVQHHPNIYNPKS